MQNTNSAATYADSIKSFFTSVDIKKWSESIGGSSAEAIEAAIYCLLSMGVGFIFKKYFKLIFTCLVISLIMIKVMEYSAFLTIDWNAIKSFFGITQGTDINMLSNKALDWIKAHMLISIASGIGFLIGYKLA